MEQGSENGNVEKEDFVAGGQKLKLEIKVKSPKQGNGDQAKTTEYQLNLENIMISASAQKFQRIIPKTIIWSIAFVCLGPIKKLATILLYLKQNQNTNGTSL